MRSVDERDLLRDADGRVVCEFCGGVMEPWSPIEGATWWECVECGAVEASVAEA